MIFKQFILCLIIVLVTISCSQIKGPDKPENLISKDKMVNILIDAKLIASASSVDKRAMTEKGIDFKTYVYKKYNIDSLQFSLSNNYYAFHIKDYKEIYAKVEDSLEALKIKYKALEAQEWKEKTKREEDSLKKLSQKKDTIVFKGKDSIRDAISKDTLRKTLSKKKFKEEGVLVKPISDIDVPRKQ